MSNQILWKRLSKMREQPLLTETVITEEKDVIKKSEDHFENSFFDKFSILRSLF